jgi:hypothetical protein
MTAKKDPGTFPGKTLYKIKLNRRPQNCRVGGSMGSMQEKRDREFTFSSLSLHLGNKTRDR